MSDQISRRTALKRTAAGVLAAGAGALDGSQILAAIPVLESDPTQPPCPLYPAVPAIGCTTFQLPPDGLTAQQRKQALDQLLAYQDRKSVV